MLANLLRVKRNAAVPTAGLVAWYTMDSIASGVLVDQMGARNGTVSGCSIVAGKIGNAVSLNGTTSDGIALPSMGVTQITISMWVWVNSLAPFQQPIIGNWNSGATTSYLLDIVGGNFRWITEGPPTYVRSAAAATGQWMHVCVYNGSDGISGIVVNNGTAITGSSTVSLRTTTGALTLGYKGDDVTPRFGGRIDQLRIYNRALSRAEISQLYAEAA